ncbi:hypothetical protein GJAV_G00234500 [Gymnothorax javanicus]|nr:hypothetical protein GJAV_G00234500 [Gymnothorax javanicus]
MPAGSSLLFLLASIVLVSLNHKTGAEITAVTFGFLATAVYACDSYLAARRWRANEGSPGAAHTSEYVRARSTSRGEMQAHPEPQ